jgi:hypothetical protein
MYCISEYIVEILPVVYTGDKLNRDFMTVLSTQTEYCTQHFKKPCDDRGEQWKLIKKILPCMWRLRRRGRRYRESRPERAGVFRSDQDIQTGLRRASQMCDSNNSPPPSDRNFQKKTWNLKVPSRQIRSAWEWHHWIDLEKDINRFFIFFILILNILNSSAEPLHTKIHLILLLLR